MRKELRCPEAGTAEHGWGLKARQGWGRGVKREAEGPIHQARHLSSQWGATGEMSRKAAAAWGEVGRKLSPHTGESR